MKKIQTISTLFLIMIVINSIVAIADSGVTHTELTLVPTPEVVSATTTIRTVARAPVAGTPAVDNIDVFCGGGIAAPCVFNVAPLVAISNMQATELIGIPPEVQHDWGDEESVALTPSSKITDMKSNGAPAGSQPPSTTDGTGTITGVLGIDAVTGTIEVRLLNKQDGVQICGVSLAVPAEAVQAAEFAKFKDNEFTVAFGTDVGSTYAQNFDFACMRSDAIGFAGNGAFSEFWSSILPSGEYDYTMNFAEQINDYTVIVGTRRNPVTTETQQAIVFLGSDTLSYTVGDDWFVLDGGPTPNNDVGGFAEVYVEDTDSIYGVGHHDDDDDGDIESTVYQWDSTPIGPINQFNFDRTGWTDIGNTWASIPGTTNAMFGAITTQGGQDDVLMVPIHKDTLDYLTVGNDWIYGDPADNEIGVNTGVDSLTFLPVIAIRDDESKTVMLSFTAAGVQSAGNSLPYQLGNSQPFNGVDNDWYNFGSTLTSDMAVVTIVDLSTTTAKFGWSDDLTTGSDTYATGLPEGNGLSDVTRINAAGLGADDGGNTEVQSFLDKSVEDIPEFSLTTLVMAVLIAGGLLLFVVRRRYK